MLNECSFNCSTRERNYLRPPRFTLIVTTRKRVVIKGNIAVAEGPDGQRAQVQKIGEKGGIATAGKHKWGVWLIEWPEDTTVSNVFRAQLRTSEAGNERHAFLKADGQYDLDTVAKGSLKNLEVVHSFSIIDPSTSFRILYSKLITISTTLDWILTVRIMTQEPEISHTLIRWTTIERRMGREDKDKFLLFPHKSLI